MDGALELVGFDAAVNPVNPVELPKTDGDL